MIDIIANAAISMIEVRVATCSHGNAPRLLKSAFVLASKDNNGRAVVAHALLVGMCSVLTLKKARLHTPEKANANQLIYSIADAEPYAAMAISAVVATFEHQKVPMTDEVVTLELSWARYTLNKLEDEMREAHLLEK